MTTTPVTPTSIQVTDQSTRAEVAEAMVHVNDLARATPPTVGTAERPSLWDRRHTLLNAMLTDWETRQETAAPALEV